MKAAAVKILEDTDKMKQMMEQAEGNPETELAAYEEKEYQPVIHNWRLNKMEQI